MKWIRERCSSGSTQGMFQAAPCAYLASKRTAMEHCRDYRHRLNQRVAARMRCAMRCAPTAIVAPACPHTNAMIEQERTPYRLISRVTHHTYDSSHVHSMFLVMAAHPQRRNKPSPSRVVGSSHDEDDQMNNELCSPSENTATGDPLNNVTPLCWTVYRVACPAPENATSSPDVVPAHRRHSRAAVVFITGLMAKLSSKKKSVSALYALLPTHSYIRCLAKSQSLSRCLIFNRQPTQQSV